jgi:hypothetical protein
LATQRILEALVKLETDSPWAEWWECKLKDGDVKSCGSKLAWILKPYGIKPVYFWDGETVRGYERKDFEQAWNRYCPSMTA